MGRAEIISGHDLSCPAEAGANGSENALHPREVLMSNFRPPRHVHRGFNNRPVLPPPSQINEKEELQKVRWSAAPCGWSVGVPLSNWEGIQMEDASVVAITIISEREKTRGACCLCTLRNLYDSQRSSLIEQVNITLRCLLTP